MSTDAAAWKEASDSLRRRYVAAVPVVVKHAHRNCDLFIHADTLRVTDQPDADPLWAMFKRANGLLEGPANAWKAVQAPFGGPNPMTSTLLGSALGAGLGYGTGAMLDQVMPEDYFTKNRWRKSLGMIGAGLGAAPGAYWSLKNHQAGHGVTDSYPFSGMGSQTPASDITGQLKLGSPEFGLAKVADMTPVSGAAFMPSIPVDAFNNVVWNDVQHPGNRFGGRSQWGDNDQSMGTPPAVASAVTGILQGASLASGGGGAVSPLDVAKTVAFSGGGGFLGGMLLGKTMGALAGLRPEAQQQLQQMGLWAGMLTGAVNAAFRP